MQKVFGFVKENLSGAERRKSAASGERVRGKGRQHLSPPQHTVARSANSAPNRRINFRMADIRPEHESGSSSAVLPRSEGIPRVRMEIVSEWRKCDRWGGTDRSERKSTRLNSSHLVIS